MPGSLRSGTDQPGGNVSALRQDVVVDYRGMAESLLPLAEAIVVQLKPGPAPSNLELFASKKVSVLGLQHHAASVGVVVMKPGCFAFMWRDEEGF